MPVEKQVWEIPPGITGSYVFYHTLWAPVIIAFYDRTDNRSLPLEFTSNSNYISVIIPEGVNRFGIQAVVIG